jgi:COMPASS component SWD2
MTSRAQVAELRGHAGVPAVVKWSPRRVMLASGCSALAFWTPNADRMMARQGA